MEVVASQQPRANNRSKFNLQGWEEREGECPKQNYFRCALLPTRKRGKGRSSSKINIRNNTPLVSPRDAQLSCCRADALEQLPQHFIHPVIIISESPHPALMPCPLPSPLSKHSLIKTNTGNRGREELSWDPLPSSELASK